MKTTDPRDSLDRKIDALLHEQPVRASEDFLQKTLDAVDATSTDRSKGGTIRWVRFALPAAAAIALAFVLVSSLMEQTAEAPAVATTDPAEPAADPLTSAEMQELFLLQEGLSGLAAVDDAGFDEDELLQELDTLLEFFES